MNNSKQIHLGYFDNKEDAIKQRREAENKYNYHVNHGVNTDTERDGGFDSTGDK